MALYEQYIGSIHVTFGNENYTEPTTWTHHKGFNCGNYMIAKHVYVIHLLFFIVDDDDVCLKCNMCTEHVCMMSVYK